MEDVMADQIKNQKEALAASIEMEKQGQAFYLKTAEKAKDKMTRDVFTFLSNEELKHIDSIKACLRGEIAGKR
jgi:rubrerythrin